MSLPPARRHALRTGTLLALGIVVSLVLGDHQQGFSAAAALAPDPVIKLRKDKPVRTTQAKAVAPGIDPTRSHLVTAPKASWPQAGVAQVAVPRPGSDNPWALALNGGRVTERARAGSLPVWVAPTAASAQEKLSTGTTSSLPAKVEVDLVGRHDDALLLKVRRTDGVAATGRVALGVDYDSFRDAYGGDWASRLRLVTQPCDGCRQTVVPTRNNGSGQLVADVPVSAKDTTFAVAAGPSGGGGDFKKADLSDGGATWSVGGSSGDFEWSLPLDAPPSLGGPQPELQLHYSSGGVDGLSSATNNQSGALGMGFELGGGGSIERKYKACSKDKGGNNGTRETGDLCFAGDSMTISVNGKSGALVLQGTDTWKLKGDDGSVIERLHGAVNGDDGVNTNDKGEYWRMTTPDGTRYYFGLNRLPGWATGRPETKSAWTAPVFGNNAGEQCNRTAFADSWCQQAYRWNLDYVVDRNGNTMSLYYETESDNYARNLTATTVSPYVRAGNLLRIEYGQRDTQAYTQKAVGQVQFQLAERCIDACSTSQPATYPDTPLDLRCTSTTNCNNHFTPTFWTQRRLAKITTQVWRDSTQSFRDVQSWTLRYDYLRGDNTGPALWLEGVTPAGLAGTSPLQMNEINFDGVARDNRVDTASDMIPPLQWFRVSAVKYGSTGDLAVTYAGVDCAPTGLPAPDTNGRRCRPQKWTPDGASTDRQDWFHKYVVTKVVQTDRTAAANAPSAPVPVVTSIDYPDPPAWHFDELDATTTVADSTWSQWRGYDRVRVTEGIAGEPQTVTDNLYFRGMDGDRTGTGGSKDVKITDSTGVVQDDIDDFGGQVREESKLHAGTVADKTITDYWRSDPTATMVRPWGTLEARHYNHKRVTQFLKVDGGYRQVATEHIYDASGRLVAKQQDNDVSTTADDACTTFEYVANPTAGLLELPARERTTSTKCGQPASSAQVLSDQRVYYDGATSYTATPTRGVVTKGERLSGFDASGNPSYETVFTAAYDAIGRQTSITDALQNTTRKDVTPAYGPTTKIVETTAKGNATTTEFDPAFGDPVAITTPDGRRTETELDALGRVSKTWQPGHTRSDPPDEEYAYLLRDDGANVVTTKVRHDDDTVDVGYELYDGLQRLRQTQEATPAGGRLVTDYRYDSRSNRTEVNGPYYDDVPPGTDLALVDPATLPKQELTSWDDQNRPLAQTIMADGAVRWQLTHDVNPGRQTVDPPDGQAPTTRILDARGRLTELRQYQGDHPTGGYDSTKYGYDAAGRLTTVTDPANNVWRYDYDVQGRKTKETDPDKGVTTYTYNAADQLTSSTDARGIKLLFTYDADNRRTATYRDSLQGHKESEWTYDTLAKGKPTSATRYVGTNAYTTAVTGYDPAGRATGTSVTLPPSEGKLAGTYSTTQTYNDDDTIATKTLPAAGDLAAETLTYGYNDQGLATSMSGYVRDLTYTPFEEPDTMTLGTSSGRWVQQLFEYDPTTRRPTRVVTNKESLARRVSDTSYEYDAAGNITKTTDVPSASSGETTDTQCFGYDYLRRLTQAWTPSSGDCAATPSTSALGGPAPYWQKWTFDKVGNRKTEQKITASGTTTSTYTYGSTQPHTLTGVSTTGPGGTTTKTFGYDASGNTTARTQSGVPETLGWDATGKLQSATKAGKTTSYVYDAEGNRLLRKDTSGTTLYLGETELSLGTDGTTLSGTRYYMFKDQTVAIRAKGKLSWLLSDLHGTPTIAIDESTQVVQRRRTTPYGDVRGTAPANWPGQKDFAGGTADPDTGLVHLGARDYDQTTGRFLSVDPVIDPEEPQQLNGYAYAGNNPVSFEDSDGQFLVAVLVPVVAIVIVVVVIYLILVEIFKEVFNETRTREVRESVWDFLCFLWRTIVRVVTYVVQVIREVIKYIEKILVQVFVKPIIRWVQKWRDNGVKRSTRSSTKGKGSTKGKPNSPRKPPKTKAPKQQKPKRTDSGKGKPDKGSRGSQEPKPEKPENPMTREGNEEMERHFPELKNMRNLDETEAYTTTRPEWEENFEWWKNFDPKDAGGDPTKIPRAARWSLAGTSLAVAVLKFAHDLGWFG